MYIYMKEPAEAFRKQLYESFSFLYFLLPVESESNSLESGMLVSGSSLHGDQGR